MFISNLVTRVYLPKSCLGDRGLLPICNRFFQPRQSRTARFCGFQYKSLNDDPFKQFLKRLHNAENCFTYRCRTAQASVVMKSENGKETRTFFQELMFARKEQAQRSVLLHVPTKDDIPYAVARCEQFGNITNAYSYPGETNNYFVLIEFSNKIAAHDLFNSCQHQHIYDIFPVFSRIIQFEKKSSISLSKVNIEIQEESKTESSLKIGHSISETIEDIYSNEKLTELDTRLRYFFCLLVKDSASGIFPYCDVFPFGSSVNGIGRRGCDLDAMIRLYPDFDAMIKLYPQKADKDGELIFLSKSCAEQKLMQQKVVNFLGNYFQTFLPGITSVQKILHARIPIIKMNHRLLKMDCDVSVNNMSAVFMSDIVHFCGEVDPRFQPLLYAVKKWAKEAEITNIKPGSCITNFGLTNLLIFFFQKEQILPSLNDAVIIVGEENSPEFKLQYLKSVEEWKNLASQNKKSLAELLIEFLSFLVEYRFDENILSLMSGKERPHSQGAVPMWVQYPFDENLNITKNVSEYELSELCNKAGIAVKSLESNLNKRNNCSKDFSVLLGIPNFKRQKKVVDVSVYFENDNFKHKGAKRRKP